VARNLGYILTLYYGITESHGTVVRQDNVFLSKVYSHYLLQPASSYNIISYNVMSSTNFEKSSTV